MRKRLLIIAGAVVVLLAIGAVVWHKLIWREVPQPGWITADQRSNFLYGSVGAERDAGIPYWIWLAMPRMFPEYMPGNGGYVSVGLSWEQGKEMPSGFSKKRVGYIRVAGNCALCHASSYRTGPDEGPEVIPFVPDRARDIQPLLTFLQNCAQDPRFNDKEILGEVGFATKLSWSDWFLYKFYLIPSTRRKLLNPQGVIIDSALRNHSLDPHSAAPLSQPAFKAASDWLKSYRVPQYPLKWNPALAAAGQPIFVHQCASCHAPDEKQTGSVFPVGDIGTDPEQAKKMNAGGYKSPALDGLWIRGPYLHNGSVPTVRDLLNPQEQRPAVFYVGNNLMDLANLGFNSTLDQEKGLHFSRFNTAQPGNSNAGHLYGTGLSKQEKDALIEYLKTL